MIDKQDLLILIIFSWLLIQDAQSNACFRPDQIFYNKNCYSIHTSRPDQLDYYGASTNCNDLNGTIAYLLPYDEMLETANMTPPITGRIWINTNLTDYLQDFNITTEIELCYTWSFEERIVEAPNCNTTAGFLCSFDVMCPLPPQIKSGYYVFLNGSTGIGHSVEYRCSGNHIMIGNEKLTCTSIGLWDVAPPTCQDRQPPVKCPPMFIKNGEVIGIDRSDRSIGSRILIRCNSGYSVSGAHILQCLSSGEWNNTVPKCSQSDNVAHLKEDSGNNRDGIQNDAPVNSRSQSIDQATAGQVQHVNWGTIIGGAIGVTLLIICSTFLVMAILAKRKFIIPRNQSIREQPKRHRNSVNFKPPATEHRRTHNAAGDSTRKPHVNSNQPSRNAVLPTSDGNSPVVFPSTIAHLTIERQRTGEERTSPEGNSSEGDSEIGRALHRPQVRATTIYVSSEDVLPRKARNVQDTRENARRTNSYNERAIDVPPEFYTPPPKLSARNVGEPVRTSTPLDQQSEIESQKWNHQRLPKSKNLPQRKPTTKEASGKPRRRKDFREFLKPPKRSSVFPLVQAKEHKVSRPKDRSVPVTEKVRKQAPYGRTLLDDSYIPYSSSSSHYSTTDIIPEIRKSTYISDIPVYYSLPRQRSRTKFDVYTEDNTPRKVVRFEDPYGLKLSKLVFFSDGNLDNELRNLSKQESFQERPSNLKHIFFNEHYAELADMRSQINRDPQSRGRSSIPDSFSSREYLPDSDEERSSLNSIIDIDRRLKLSHPVRRQLNQVF